MLYQLSYAHHIFLIGPPERTRTSDLRIRSPLLYPAELQAEIHILHPSFYICHLILIDKMQNGRGERI